MATRKKRTKSTGIAGTDGSAGTPPPPPQPTTTTSDPASTRPFLGYETTGSTGFGLAARVGARAGRGAGTASGDAAPVVHDGGSHLLSIGATGSGKTNLLIANLLRYEGSAIVVDIRGDAARATERFRREGLGQATHVLDPFGVTGRPTARLDPLDVAALPNTEIESEAQSIAATLAADHLFAKDPYWQQQAASLIGSNVAHLFEQPDPEKRSMNRIVDMLFADDVPYQQAVMLDSEVKKDGFAYRGMAAFVQLPDGTANTRYCVLSTAHAMLHSFRSSAVRSALGPSTVNLADLLHGRPVTIYLVLPVERMASHGVVLRLWLDTLLQVLLRRATPPVVPTMVLVDEAAQIGPSPALKTVATYLRASGVRLWTFWQDLSQLRALYPLDWPTLVNNTSGLTFMPGTGLAARELAAMAGVAPSAVASLAADEQLVCETGREPRTVRMARYWLDPRFAGRFDPIPRYGAMGAVR